MEKELLKKQVRFQTKEVNKDSHTISGVFSTGDEDRHGEIVAQDGWLLDKYLENPVVLWAHDHYTPAIGKMIELKLENGQLVGTIQFAVEEDKSGLAATIFDLYAEGYMRAFSVGFMNNKWEMDQENDVIILKENELYEVSCVNVPANAMALAKSKGVDMKPLEDLKSGKRKTEIVEVSKSNVESVRAAIKVLTEALKTAEGSEATPETKGRTQVEIPATKSGRISKRSLNIAIRSLLKAKRDTH